MWLRQLLTQMRLAKASLLNAPAFSLAVISTLALTLTALFVVLSLINVYFFKPLPVQQESRLAVVELQTGYGDDKSSGFQSYPALTHLFNNQNSFERQFMTNTSDFVALNLPGEPKFASVFATSEYYKVLNVPLILGTHFPDDLELNNKFDGILISESMWRKHFNADSNVIGQSLSSFGDVTYTIKGVVSSSFSAPYMFREGMADIWFPMSSDRRHFATDFKSPWGEYFKFLKIVGVRKAGLSNADVQADLNQQLNNIEAEWRAGEERLTSLSTVISDYRHLELGDKDHLSLFMLAGTLALVLIALVNVSNLFFSRAVAQQRNLALQAILGAKRKTLFNALFSQTFLLVSCSMLVALFLSAWGIKIFKHLATGHLPLVQSIGIDVNLVMIAIVITLSLAYLFSWLNAKLINYQSLNSHVQASGKGASKQGSGTTIKWLIGCQMLLASLVVISSQMALTKALDTINKPLGSKVENLYSVTGFIPGRNDDVTPAEAVEKRLQLVQALKQHPDVLKVAEGTSPVQKQQYRQAITDMSGHTKEFIPGIWVGQDYFDITGVNIIEGRTFSDATIRGEAFEFLVSKNTAEALSPNESIIGKTYEGLGGNVFEVVGVTDNFHHPLYDEQDQGKRFWWPVFPYALSLVIEMQPGKELTQEKVLQMYRDVHPKASLWQYLDLEQEYDQLLYLDTVTLWVCIILALFTVLLAAVGIYGVLSYNLQSRRFEFGIKMAVGAKASHLYKLQAKQTLLPLVLAVVAALVMSLTTYVLLSESVTNWLRFDFTLVASAVLFTFLIALAASFKPLHNAIKSEPMKALRNE